MKTTLQLLIEGATIPFISRYRKEKTGGLDEVQIGNIHEAYRQHTDLEKRREYILGSIEEQGVLKNELKEQILGCKSMTSLEDLYLPYKPKRKTKAEIARKLGLEPLAGTLMRQDVSDVINLAKRFVKGGVTDEEAALAGARDIMAEWISERTAARENVRKHFLHSAIIRSKVVKGKDDADSKFRDYFDFDQPLKKCPGHRFLAMKRAEDEGVIRLSLTPLRPEGIERLERYFIRRDGPTSEQIKLAIADSYKRLLEPSIETTPRSKLTPKPFKFLLRT